ncbi:hypothetical protein [Colwellia sp. MB3u-41]
MRSHHFLVPCSDWYEWRTEKSNKSRSICFQKQMMSHF